MALCQESRYHTLSNACPLRPSGRSGVWELLRSNFGECEHISELCLLSVPAASSSMPSSGPGWAPMHQQCTLYVPSYSLVSYDSQECLYKLQFCSSSILGCLSWMFPLGYYKAGKAEALPKPHSEL